MSTSNIPNLNGQWNKYEGKNGEKFRSKVDMSHFKRNVVDIDTYLDADIGIVKWKCVGFSIDEDKYEPCVTNINSGKNTNGWIPHFVFTNSNETPQAIRIARIDPSWYGQHKDIEWLQE